MKYSKTDRLLGHIAIAGNILITFWITYNGIDEGFSGTFAEKISYVSLVILLLLNSIIIYQRQR